MDTKVVFRALLWSFAAFFIWMIISAQIWPPPPPETPDAAGPVTQPPGEGRAAQGQPPAGPTAPNGQPTAVAAPATALTARGAQSTRSVTIGGLDGGPGGEYRMQLELTTLAASITSATLADFALHVNGEQRYILLDPVPGSDGQQLTSLALEKVNIDGQELPLADVDWNLEEESLSSNSAEFWLEIVDADDRPVVRLTRSYRLDPQPIELKRYDLQLTLGVQNLDDRPHDVIVTVLGPVGIPQEGSRMDNRAVSVGVRDSDAVELNTEMFAKAVKGSRKLFDVGNDPPLWWMAVDNKFFTCLIAPLDPATHQEGPSYLAEAQTVDLDRDPETSDDVTIRFVVRAGQIPTGGSAEFPLACYLGPKDRQVFWDSQNEDYLRRDYGLLISRMYTWCTFSWLAEFMISLLGALRRVVFNYGVAIIILVLVVRTLLHPLTKKGQVNMMKMQKQMGKLAPKMEELKKKYANDKMRMNSEIQKLYQTEGINPAGQMFTCIPMFIQMPIWIALWTSLNNNIAMRHEPFLFWIHDLTAPDALISFAGSYNLPLLGAMIGPVTGLNLLPILLSVTMYSQQKLMPKPTPPKGQSSTQADQAAMMQKMMPIMSVFFGLILYNAPSGLTLYIMASTMAGTLEQWRIRKHIKEMEASGTLEGAAATKPRGPRGPLWWQRMRHNMKDRVRQLQKQAEDAQRLRSKKH